MTFAGHARMMLEVCRCKKGHRSHDPILSQDVPQDLRPLHAEDKGLAHLRKGCRGPHSPELRGCPVAPCLQDQPLARSDHSALLQSTKQLKNKAMNGGCSLPQALSF